MLGREGGFGRVTRRKPQFPAKNVFAPVGVFSPEWTPDMKNGLRAASHGDGRWKDQKRPTDAIRQVVANEDEALAGGRWQHPEGSGATPRDGGRDCRRKKAGQRKQQQKKRGANDEATQFVRVDADFLDTMRMFRERSRNGRRSTVPSGDKLPRERECGTDKHNPSKGDKRPCKTPGGIWGGTGFPEDMGLSRRLVHG